MTPTSSNSLPLTAPPAGASPRPAAPRRRIGIEAQRLFRPRKYGMDVVALELIRHLQEIDTENEYFIFVKPDEDREVIRETPNFRIIEVPGGPYPYWEQVLLPRAAAQAGIELLHCTSNTAPLRAGRPLVLTLHDVIFLEPLNLRLGTWYQRLGNLYRRWNVPRVVHACQRIITISHFEGRRIREKLPLPDGQLQVVYNGVGQQFRAVTDPAVLADARRRLELPDQFMLFMANTDPKKNFRGLLRAMAQLKAQQQLKLKLVILNFKEADLQALLNELSLTDLRADIKLCGYVLTSDLPTLYSLAELFLYPSLREGFGLPILEAMSCGTPVITSNTSAMPEVAGDAAVLIDPFRPETIAAAIMRLQNDPAERAALVAKGFLRIRQFSWQETARQVRAVYEEVLARQSHSAR
ncbi:glycosyltransferase family 4 protein [Hymenobacter daeguensis]